MQKIALIKTKDRTNIPVRSEADGWGHMNYIIPEGKIEIYLTIAEIATRDAEGCPKYMEQESWVDNIIVKKHINAKGIWWSQGQFATINDTIVYEQYLIEIGALISEIF